MKSCEQCGEPFTPRRPEQRFCGAKCSGLWVANHRRKAPPRRQTEATREKLRQAALGRRISAETRAKIGAAHAGREKSPEHRARIAAALTGNPRVNNSGERNPNFRHGQCVGERAYRELLEISRCSDCGRSDGILDVHHLDGDHHNDKPGNLEVLCHSCHGKRHGRPRGIAETKPRRRG